MKYFKLIVVLVGLMFFTSCSEKLYVNYQTESSNTGTIVLKPIKPTERTYVTINDSLIVDRKFVKSLTIKNVPDGVYDIHYTSDNIWYKENLDDKIRLILKNNKEMTQFVDVPPYNAWYYIADAMLWVLILFP